VDLARRERRCYEAVSVKSAVRQTRKAKSRCRFAIACARVLFAVALIAGFTHSGSRYFYCEAMGLAAVDPCLDLDAARSDSPSCPERTLQGRLADCCEIITLPSVPNAAQSEGPRVPAASVVATAPPYQSVGHALDDQPRARIAFARWREPPRSPQKARARLMVFLT